MFFFINFMTIILLKQLIRELQLISDSLNEGILENFLKLLVIYQISKCLSEASDAEYIVL